MSPISSHPVLEDAARSIEYQAVFDSVIARIVEDGFPIQEMGIDMTAGDDLHEPGASGYAFFETVNQF